MKLLLILIFGAVVIVAVEAAREAAINIRAVQQSQLDIVNNY